MNELDEFVKLIHEVDVNELSLTEQITVMLAFGKLMSEVKPIYMRHLASKQDKSTFLFKL